MYYFKQVKDNRIVSVEAKSVNVASPGFVEASKAEYDDFVASLPAPEVPIKPVRDFAAEIDDLKARLEKLEKK